MSQIELDFMTPRTFYNKISGHFNVIETNFKSDWERSRWVVFNLLQPHIKPNTIKKPLDLIRFEWEIEKEQRELNERDLKVMKKWQA